MTKYKLISSKSINGEKKLILVKTKNEDGKELTEKEFFLLDDVLMLAFSHKTPKDFKDIGLYLSTSTIRQLRKILVELNDIESVLKIAKFFKILSNNPFSISFLNDLFDKEDDFGNVIEMTPDKFIRLVAHYKVILDFIYNTYKEINDDNVEFFEEFTNDLLTSFESLYINQEESISKYMEYVKKILYKIAESNLHYKIDLIYDFLAGNQELTPKRLKFLSENIDLIIETEKKSKFFSISKIISKMEDDFLNKESIEFLVGSFQKIESLPFSSEKKDLIVKELFLNNCATQKLTPKRLEILYKNITPILETFVKVKSINFFELISNIEDKNLNENTIRAIPKAFKKLSHFLFETEIGESKKIDFFKFLLDEIKKVNEEDSQVERLNKKRSKEKIEELEK